MQKKGNFITLCSVSLTLTGFMLASPVYADLYWVCEVENRGVPGEPDGVKVGKHYYTTQACRMEVGERITLMDFSDGTMYVLDPKEKTYEAMIPQQMPEEMGKEEQELMKALVQGMTESVEVTPTRETKMISGYKCRKYTVVFMGVTSDYWLSKDVKGYEEFEKISESMARGLEKNPMMKQVNIAGMMGQLDGFPVKTVNRIPGSGSMTTTLRSIEVKRLSPVLFRIPSGYSQKEETVTVPAESRQLPQEMPEDVRNMLKKMMQRSGEMR
jgi:hypothetical protein